MPLPASPLVPGQLLAMLLTQLQRGDVVAATQLYEHFGTTVGPALIDQARGMDPATRSMLARVLSAARDYAGTARVLEASGDPRAADFYEQAGQPERAAMLYQQQGEVLKAGVAFERAGQPEQALRMYEAAGAVDSMVQCLVRQGRLLEAADLYRAARNPNAEVDLLSRVPVTSPQRLSAVKRLAQLMEQFGMPDQAIQLYLDTLGAVPDAARDAELVLQLKRLADARGNNEARTRADVLLQMAPAPAFGRPPSNPVAPAFGRPPSQPGGAAFGRPTTGSGEKKRTRSEEEMRAVMVSHNDRINAQIAPGVASEPPANPFETAMETGSSLSATAYQALKAIPLFGGLAHADMEALFRISAQVAYAPATIVIEQGMQGVGLLVIVAGSVGVAKVSPDGSMTALAVLGPGQYVGEVSLLDAGPTSARVIAQTPVEALFIARDRFDEFLSTRDAAALRIYRTFSLTLAERLRAANLRA